MKKNELATVKNIVKDVLVNHKQARDSDMTLYVKVCERMNGDVLGKPFCFVLLNLKDLNLPNFETVRRARQKIQAECPELGADADVEAQRMINEDAFRDFARGMS